MTNSCLPVTATAARRRPIVWLLAAAIAGATHWAGAAAQPSSAVDELGAMSLEQLANVQVTSVSKTVEPVRTAPAAIYVITHNDIVRSGATSIPEVLRLGPNPRATQMSAASSA